MPAKRAFSSILYTFVEVCYWKAFQSLCWLIIVHQNSLCWERLVFLHNMCLFGGLYIKFYVWRYGFWPKVIIFGHASWGDSKKYPFIKLEFQFANFGRILVMKMHQKLSHFGQLNDCFSIPEVWLRPDTVATPWHIIKTTVVDFKSQIKSLIGQIWLTEISWNRYFEVFSVPYCIPVGFWALNTNFQMWKRPWNREIAFSRSLGHLDGSLKIALPKTEDFPKKMVFK